MAKSRICVIEGCGKAVFARAWCQAHYTRFLRHGDPLGGGTPDGEALAFLEGTVLSFDGDECLIWPFATDGKGYGRIRIDGKLHTVSRVVCEREHGPPPTPKHQAAHSCGKGHEGCVNRKHLGWKSRKENEADKLLHGTHVCGERHSGAKLTAAQVLEIRAARGSQTAIASRFGVSQTTICAIINRRKWAHV